MLLEPGITKINLTTGPQAITGSTRMQATTIETYVVGAVVETAVERALGRVLGAREMARLGFGRRSAGRGPERRRRRGVAAKLGEFRGVLEGARAALTELAALTDVEAAAYAGGRFSTYYAENGLITVFIDSTERSPTFRLFPLDTVKEPKRKCWIQVWTKAADAGRGLARLPRPAVPGAGPGDVPAALRDGGRRSVSAAGGPGEPEEGGGRPGGPVRFFVVRGEHGRAGAEEGRPVRPGRA